MVQRRLYPVRVTESTTQEPRPEQEPRSRVRWGWITGCILLGLSAIMVGFLLVARADRAGYVGSVFANIGTTLLLVGIVVLLERRIVDTAASAVRRAVDAGREASDARIERMVADLEDRISAEWARTDGADVDAMKRRTAALTDQAVAQIVEEATRLDDGTKYDTT